MHRSRAAQILYVVGLLLGCTHPRAGEPPAAEVAERPVGVVSAPVTAPIVAKKGELDRPHYDLASQLERAELRQGSALLIDFGTPGAAKYTFGGWLSGAGRDHKLDGSSVLVVPEKVFKLALPAESDGAATLSMRLRGFATGSLSLHINGELVSDLKLNGERFESVTLPLRAGLLRAGENLVQLRVTKTGSAPSVLKAGLALDWLRLSPHGSAGTDAPPPDLIGSIPSPGIPTPSLRIPAGHTLSYAIELPARAQLRTAMAHGAGTLRVSVARDGAPKELLAEIATRTEQARLDLGRFGGELLRLDLSAQAADVELQIAQIVTVVQEHEIIRTPHRPAKNAIILLIDTLRADKLSPYKPDSRVKTPGLSTFVQKAAVMHNARTQENWTKPSVATLLSSLLPWQHNAVTGDAVLPPSVQLLPELLQERGFYTGAFIANGYVSDKFGFKQGWRTYRNYIREGRRTTAQYVAADVLQWLDERPKDQPFFLYVHTIDPHVPYIPPQSFLQMYDAAPYAGPVDFRQTRELLEKVKIGSLKLKDRDKERLQALYDAEISYHDVHFAAIMQGLAERGLAEDTVVVITSDHGEEFWDHGSVGHGHSVYDELLHVPLIVRVPGLTESKPQLAEAVGLVDVMPTVLEALGQPIPEQLVGHSFLPALRGQGHSAPRVAVSGFMNGWRTLAVGRYKLIQRTLDHTWLYDTKADPHETQDLQKTHPLALRYARGLLGLALAEHSGGQSEVVQKLRKHKSQKAPIDAETEAQLRALGYVGSSAK